MVFLDNIIRNIQPQAGTLARLLRCKERLEQARQHILWNAWTIVLNLNYHLRALLVSSQLQIALPMHGVDGVIDQVRPDLVQLTPVGFDEWQILVIIAL